MTDFDDEVVVVGQPLPRIVAVQALDGFHIGVNWQTGTRLKAAEVVDLGPAVARFKLYAPLRDNPTLFATVRPQEHGSRAGQPDDISTTDTPLQKSLGCKI